jgi:hypothetical protein
MIEAKKMANLMRKESVSLHTRQHSGATWPHAIRACIITSWHERGRKWIAGGVLRQCSPWSQYHDNIVISAEVGASGGARGIDDTLTG